MSNINDITAKPFQLRRVGGSLDIRFPATFVRANDLKVGDYVIVDMSRLKILRAEDFELLGRKPELEAAE
jgi:antitoxin component of MazEF toxin-antitoxin module